MRKRIAIATADVDGAFVRDFSVDLNKSVRLRMLCGPRGRKGPQLTNEYELLFVGAKACKIAVSASPWLQVNRFQELTGSPELRRCMRRAARALHHYRIILEEGFIDVIAVKYELLLLDQLPHVSAR